MDDTTSGDVAQAQPASPTQAAGSRNYQKRAKQNIPETKHAEPKRADQWLQILVDVLVEGSEYGIQAFPVNYQNDSALIRLPGLRICSGSGSGSHIVFWQDMMPSGAICVACQKKADATTRTPELP